MADLCDVPACGGEAKLYGAGYRRCIAHVERDALEVRSDVPPVRRLRVRLAFMEIARAEAARACEQEAEDSVELCRRVVDATSELAVALNRQAEAVRILEMWGDLGCESALRALRGETR